MRILIVGGTVFLSRAVAEVAVRQGHAVVCAARGVSGDPPDGTFLARTDWTMADGLSPLRGMSFDAVIDVSRRRRSHVGELVKAFGSKVEHWTFVSTCLVYRDRSSLWQGVDAPLIDPAIDETDKRFAQVKLASEELIRCRLGERALIVRPGLVVGPGDLSDRFGYWPARLARGGRVIAPGHPDDLVQWIDVRDLAEWLVESAESRRTGVFDAIGVPVEIAKVLTQITTAIGAEAELEWVPQDFLLDVGIVPWAGTRSLPLWVRRPRDAGLLGRDPTRTLEHGLRARDIDDSARAALTWERELGLDRPRRAGLTPGDERLILDHWRAGRRTSLR